MSLGADSAASVVGQFEAWDYGPVHPDLCHKLKVYGSDTVQNLFHGFDDLPEGEERAIIDEAFDSLGKAGAGRLVNATHRSGGEWTKNYIPGGRRLFISNEDILNEYRSLDSAAS